MRARWLLPVVGCAALAVACDDPRSRAFAVTLLDSTTLDCQGYAQDLLADPAELEQAAKDRQHAWKKQQQASPPQPLARVLRVNELETRMQAWFDPSSDEGAAAVPASDAGLGIGGAGAGGAPADLAYRYDDPGIVYQGDLHDDYVEGSYAERIDTDEADEAQGRRLCGPRTRAQGTLTITTAGGALGRIRWTHTTYVDSPYSACAGRIECVRDIAIEGLETR